MTITDVATKYRYEGNTVTDTFAFAGKAFTAADLVVEIITRATDVLEETLTITTDYSVTILTDGTASIVTVAGKIPDNTQDIQIRRDLAKTQTTDLPVGTVFPAKLVENSIDRSVGIGQDLNEAVTRALKFPATSSTTTAELPEPTDDAVLAFDGTTGLFKAGATNTDLVAGAAAADASATAAAASASAASTSATNSASSAAASAASAVDAADSAAGVNLPSVGAGDATKLLKVNTGETGYELAAKLPDFTASKQGAIVIQNAADDGFSFLTSQGTAGQPVLSGGADADPTIGTLGIPGGGTGNTTAAAAFSALKQAATTSATGVIEIATDAEFQTGTATDRAVTPANILNSLGFAEYVDSGEYTITASSTITFAHGLGREPKDVKVIAICKTAEYGWSISDKIFVNYASANGSAIRGVGISFDSTNVKADISNSAPLIQYNNATTWALADLTNANWKLILRVWA
jgi:hypothetical protein